MKRDPVLKVTAKFLIPLIMLFALYVQFHGEYSPGGGFQAGVIFASAIILYGLVFGVEQARQVLPVAFMIRQAAAGVLLFGGWMVIEGRTELGVVVAFISGFEKIMDPARELLNFYRRMAQMRVQYRLIVAAMRGEAA